MGNISYDDMLELAEWGAKVLQAKSIDIAKRWDIRLTVLSSFSESTGTKISKNDSCTIGGGPIVGIAHRLDMSAAKISNPRNLDLKHYLNHLELIAPQESCYVFAKTLHDEIRGSFETIPGVSLEIDNDIGIITVVGDYKRNPDFVGNMTSKIESGSIRVKHICPRANSVSVLVPFQSTEATVSIIHDYIQKVYD
jgi:aspartokinase